MKYFYDTEFIEDGKTIDLISIGIVAEDGRTYYAISTEFNPKKASQWVIDNVLSKLPLRWITEQDSPRIREESNAWKSREQIKKDIIAFIGEDKPEFWAYYADYDHVALCQLFGKMIDLPKGYPMYTNDIKQLCNYKGNPQLPKTDNEHNALDDAKWNMNMFYLLNSDQREHITDMPHCWCNPEKTVVPNGNMHISHNKVTYPHPLHIHSLMLLLKSKPLPITAYMKKDIWK